MVKQVKSWLEIVAPVVDNEAIVLLTNYDNGSCSIRKLPKKGDWLYTQLSRIKAREVILQSMAMLVVKYESTGVVAVYNIVYKDIKTLTD